MNLEKGIPEIHSMDKKIVETLLATKAINFEGIGQTIAKVGAESLLLDDGFERWCGSDLRIYRWPRGKLGLEELEILKGIARGGLGR